ncbi:unnamed protein product [Miscanthus lutarioriparius]|uniref:Uncharacterized protein n=1 Tax=Miscanthus lutarioriparius TaxID=422564 RepID=A0A811Q3Y0_9POAL|nr:unnamed protein product [Miscanthus lutarioriparius]
MRRALRENNGVTAVSMAAISSTLVLVVGRAVTAMVTLSLETKLMALSLVWVGLYRLQRVLVGKRRSSGHWLVQYGAMVAYYLPAPLAFYAANAVCSTSHTKAVADYMKRRKSSKSSSTTSPFFDDDDDGGDDDDANSNSSL